MIVASIAAQISQPQQVLLTNVSKRHLSLWLFLHSQFFPVILAILFGKLAKSAAIAAVTLYIPLEGRVPCHAMQWPTLPSAVGVLSQFIQNPGQAHWEALKRVIMYLGCTKDLWLTFGGCTTTLVEGYCDADWASQKHRHSISGYSFHLGNVAVSWSSKKQYI